MAIPHPATRVHLLPLTALCPSLVSGERRTGAAQKGNSYTLNLAPSGRTLLIYDVPDTFPTASSHPQVCQRELCHGLCPSPVRSSSWGAPSARTIPPTLDRLQLVIDDTITRMPHLPKQ